MYNKKSSAVAEMGDRLASIDMGQKVAGAAAPLSEVGIGSPSNTMSWRPTSIPSGILIHLAVWPQQTRVENWGFGTVRFFGVSV